jgi:prepilin-type N-terminal cleavage/methylation domain-containing protein
MLKFKRNWNKEKFRKDNDQGFTLLETLIVIAVTALIAGAFFSFLHGGIGAWNISYSNYSRAIKVLALERYVRERCDETHVPCWDCGSDIAADVLVELKASRYGDCIADARVLYDSRRMPRGVFVAYSVGGITGEIDALFASIPVMGDKQ